MVVRLKPAFHASSYLDFQIILETKQECDHSVAYSRIHEKH